MAFESLSEKLQNVFKNLRGKGRLTEADVKAALKEVKIALLEADVNFKVVKNFVKSVQERAIGQDVMNGLNPGQMVIKIVNEELVSLMGSETTEIALMPGNQVTVAWICTHDADNEIVNSQANMTKANQYSLWHEVYETTGYDARNATYKNGTFIAEDGTDLLALFKEKSKNGAGYELYSKRWLQYAKNGWKKENDLVLKIGFDSSGLYDIGQEKGYGAAQNMWMKGVSQSMFEARV